jgi:gliding motility-associated-like protein
MIGHRLLVPLVFLCLAVQLQAHDHSTVAVQFHENRGQWPGQVLYRALTPGGAVFVEGNCFTHLLQRGGELEGHGRPGFQPKPLQMHAFKVHFEGGRASGNAGAHRMPHQVNYFLGNDPAQWAGGVPVFAQVELTGVYPGIDLRVDGHSGMKYDWLVAKGADPSRIVMRFEGQDAIQLEEGLLVIRTTAGDVIEQRPVAWQEVDGRRVPVQCNYALDGDRVRFELPQGHDPRYPLVIDPQVIFSSYSGSTGDNFGFTATYDAGGHLYGGGMVRSAGYPVTTGVIQSNYGGGENDMAISKFSPLGNTLIWSTYIGGSANEVPHSMVVNSSNELYILGTTNSANFPVTAGCYDGVFGGGTLPPFAGSSYGFTYTGGCDMVVVHLAADAQSLVGSTYVGGSANDGLNQQQPTNRNYGDPFRGEIILDLEERPMVASTTASTDMYTSPGAPQATFGGQLDAYVFRMDPALTSMLWATYYGGTGVDAGYGIQVSSTGEIFITGGSTSTDLPMAGNPFDNTQNGGVDGFIARYASTGAPLLSTTFLGTLSYDQSYFVQLNTADEVFVVGQTTGPYPVTPGKYANPNATQFVHKFTNDLSTSLWSTRIGGAGNENISPSAFLVSNCGQIYFSGWAGSTQSAGAGQVISSTTGLPVTPDAFQSTTNGSDFYLMMLEPEAISLGYATFFGGTSAEHVDGGTSRFDKNGIVYQAVCAGCGGQTYPTTPGVWSNTNNSTNCNLGVFKMDFEQAVQVGIQASASDLNACLGEPIVFNAVGTASTWIWDLGYGGPPVTGAQVSHVYTQEGTYEVLLVGIDSTSCNFADTALVTINVWAPADLRPSFLLDIEPTCQGFNVGLQNTSTGSTDFFWNFGDGTTGGSNTTSHFYQLPDVYTITLTLIDPYCPDSLSISSTLTLDPPPLDLDLPSPVALCNGGSVPLNAGSGFTTYIWSTGQFTSTITVQQPGTYWVNVNDGICFGTDTVVVQPQPVHAPTPDLFICPGIDAVLSPTFAVTSILWSTGETTSTIVPEEEGIYSFAAVDVYGCTFQDTVMVGFVAIEEGLASIPNVFTPNNDQQNDRFLVGGMGLESFKMEVFNRWGRTVFTSTNPNNGWNGGLDNSADKVPDGTYFYVITFRDRCSTEPLSTHTGHVTLLR